MRLGLAFKSFWRTLRDERFADQARGILAEPGDSLKALPEGKPGETPAPEPAAKPDPKPEAKPAPQPSRSEALTLIAALQRDSRLVDFLQEDLTGYSNDEIGAAARDVQRDAKACLTRIFALEPVRTEPEESSVSVDAAADPAAQTLVGQVGDAAPASGTLVHHGWRATKCELPSWSGRDSAALVVAPAEIEVGSNG